MRAILIADDRGNRHLAEARHPALNVGFAGEGIHAFEHAFGDRPDLSHPDRPAENEDVVAQDFRADTRPVVALALVRRHARGDIVIGDADGFGQFDILLGQMLFQHGDHGVGRACFARGFLERAVQGDGGERHRCSPRLLRLAKACGLSYRRVRPCGGASVPAPCRGSRRRTYPGSCS